MDSLEIRGLSCRCIIGILPRERREAQRVRMDVELAVDLERAGKSGRIAHTIDYSRVSAELIALLQFRRYSLLEVAAEECAAWLFAGYPTLQGVTLRMTKPRALAGQAESGGVRIERKRPPEASRQATSFGFVETQLETSEATISLIGLNGGATFGLDAIAAQSALLVPLTPRFESARPLAAHEPATLRVGEGCRNRDAVVGTVVVCAWRAPRV